MFYSSQNRTAKPTWSRPCRPLSIVVPVFVLSQLKMGFEHCPHPARRTREVRSNALLSSRHASILVLLHQQGVRAPPKSRSTGPTPSLVHTSARFCDFMAQKRVREPSKTLRTAFNQTQTPTKLAIKKVSQIAKNTQVRSKLHVGNKTLQKTNCQRRTRKISNKSWQVWKFWEEKNNFCQMT